MESEKIEESVVALRQAVHYILLQTKKDPSDYHRDDLYNAISKLTQIADTLTTVTKNASASLSCISYAKRLSFSAMKYLQIKHSGENFIAAEDEFKKDVSLFKVHYASLLLYCESTIGKIPDTKTSESRPVSHFIKSEKSQTSHSLPESPTNTLLHKSHSQPCTKTHNPSSQKEISPPDKNNRPPPVRSATVGSNVQTATPSHPQLSKYRQTEGKSGGPPTTALSSKSSTNNSFDEWDSIERELLGTIQEDNVIIPSEKLNSSRLSTFGGQNDLLKILLQQGLTPEMILNSTEEELFLVLERSLSDSVNIKEKGSTQEIDDRLKLLEKQLLGD